MKKKINITTFFIILFFLSACSFTTTHPDPDALIDGDSIVNQYIDIPLPVTASVKYGNDLPDRKHDIKNQLLLHRNYNQLKKKLGYKVRKESHINVFLYNPELYFSKMSRVGEYNNLYEIQLKEDGHFKKQINDYSCWASCAQYLMWKKDKTELTQKEILEKVGNDVNGYGSSGDVFDFFQALGGFDVWYSSTDAFQLLSVLAEGQPLMLGLSSKGQEGGHAVIVIGAKFSFVNPIDPSAVPAFGIAFSEFTILDPWDGELVTRRFGGDITIDFLLSFYDLSSSEDMPWYEKIQKNLQKRLPVLD